MSCDSFPARSDGMTTLAPVVALTEDLWKPPCSLMRQELNVVNEGTIVGLHAPPSSGASSAPCRAHACAYSRSCTLALATHSVDPLVALSISAFPSLRDVILRVHTNHGDATNFSLRFHGHGNNYAIGGQPHNSHSNSSHPSGDGSHLIG